MENTTFHNTQLQRLPVELLNEILTPRYREQYNQILKQLPRKCPNCKFYQPISDFWKPTLMTARSPKNKEYANCQWCRNAHQYERMVQECKQRWAQDLARGTKYHSRDIKIQKKAHKKAIKAMRALFEKLKQREANNLALLSKP